MSGFGASIPRPHGRALVVGSAACRGLAISVLAQLGFQATETDDPYSAMAELCRRPLAYRTIILSLSGVYREELHLIDAAKRRYPHLEVWLTHTDGRAAALAEASRLGADGLLSEDGLHRFTKSVPEPEPAPAMTATAVPGVRPVPSAPPEADTEEQRPQDAFLTDAPLGEAVLTADELRALLEDHHDPAPGERQRD